MDHRPVRANAPVLVAGAILGVLGVSLAALVGRTDVPPPAKSVASATSVAPEIDAGASQLVDLLRHTQASVAVSSQVGNQTDLPEHLVDGKTDTAWQGKTGDLVGAWIAFRVPNDTRVRRIGIVAGFDAISSRFGDLFVQNVRIARILVRREGALVGEWRLDPDLRAMQYFDTDLEGGEYKLEIAEIKAGTRKEWRELCVSELVVLGYGATEASERVPAVDVGGLGIHNDYPISAEGPFPDEDALCNRQLTVPDGFPVDACLAEGTLRGVDGGARFLELREVTATCGSAHGLAVRTARGWFQLPLEFGRSQCGDSDHAVDAAIASAMETHGVLLVTARFAEHTHHKFDEHGFETDDPTMVFTERTIACRDSGASLRCAIVESGSAPSLVNGTIDDGEVDAATARRGTWRWLAIRGERHDALMSHVIDTRGWCSDEGRRSDGKRSAQFSRYSRSFP